MSPVLLKAGIINKIDITINIIEFEDIKLKIDGLYVILFPNSSFVDSHCKKWQKSKFYFEKIL